MRNGGVSLNDRRLSYLDRSIGANSSQIVPQKVNDHRQLGAVLVTGKQLGQKRGVLLGGLASGPRPLDGTGDDMPFSCLVEQFRTGTDHRKRFAEPKG